jgi:hypothetical protein
MANQNQQIEQTIIDELGLTDLPQEKKDALITKMMEVVLKRIFLETMEKLTEADQEAYSKMIDANATPEELDVFLKEKIPGYDQMVASTISNFKEEMKGKA